MGWHSPRRFSDLSAPGATIPTWQAAAETKCPRTHSSLEPASLQSQDRTEMTLSALQQPTAPGSSKLFIKKRERERDMNVLPCRV